MEFDESDHPSFPDISSCQSSNKTRSTQSGTGDNDRAFTAAGAQESIKYSPNGSEYIFGWSCRPTCCNVERATKRSPWFLSHWYDEENHERQRNTILLNGLKFSKEHSMKIILATAVLHNICTTCNDLERCYFDGTDGGSGFPRTPISIYNELYPLNKVVCPRCKKTSNGAMTLSDGCPCFARPLVTLAPGALLLRQPNLREDIKSPNPSTRREAYRRLLFSVKPADF